MQTQRRNDRYEMTLLPPLDVLIPDDHYLKRLNRVLDLSFIHDFVRDRYCQTNGRPSIDPEVVIRLFLIQSMDGITHVRELMRQVQVNLAYRWFIGYSIEETLPDHSTLSKALDRFGDDVFNELFERSISCCQSSGLIEGKVLYVDATTIRADIDRNRVGKPDSPDPDARYGHFPNKKLEPGYKQHTVADGKSRVIVGVSVTPANGSEHNEAVDVIDSAIDQLGHPPEAVCADAAYGSGENCQKMLDRGIRLVSPPRKSVTGTGSNYFTTNDFVYDEDRDVFICPAGLTLKYIGGVKERPKQRRYAGLRSACRNCRLRNRCTKSSRRELKVGINHGALIRLRADSQTDSFRMLYRSRAPVIEGVFAEAKQWHGLRRAWRRGLSKMLVQSLLVSTVINFKRLAAVFSPLSALEYCLKIVMRVILTIEEQFLSNRSKINPIKINNVNIECDPGE